MTVNVTAVASLTDTNLTGAGPPRRNGREHDQPDPPSGGRPGRCLLYTSEAADD